MGFLGVNVAVGLRTSKYAVTLPCGSAPEGEADDDGLSDGDGLLLTLMEIDDDGEAVGLMLGETDGETLADGETDGLALPLGDTDPLGLTLALSLADGEMEGDSLGLGEMLTDGETLALGLPALGLGEDDGD